MKDCATAAGLGSDKRITNPSGRKTLVQKLRDSNVLPTEIVQITGHKNLQSINSYNSLGEKQQEAIPALLSTTSTDQYKQFFPGAACNNHKQPTRAPSSDTTKTRQYH